MIFPSNGGTAQGYLAKPTSGSGKGVIVFQEWWGLNDNIKGIADRFAAEYSSSLLGPLVRFGLSCLMGLAGCFKTFLLRPRGNQLV